VTALPADDFVQLTRSRSRARQCCKAQAGVLVSGDLPRAIPERAGASRARPLRPANSRPGERWDMRSALCTLAGAEEFAECGGGLVGADPG
jgi:hypothetical protein